MQGFFRCDRIIDEQGNSPCLPEIVGMLLGGHSKAAGQQKREWRDSFMKKLFAGVLTAAVVLSIGATGISAAVRGEGCHYGNCGRDRVCDYTVGACYNNKEDCVNSVYTGNGTCIHNGNYVDADGSGVCDHYEEREAAGTCGQGGHHGNGRGCRR